MENNFWSHVSKVLNIGVVIVTMFITTLLFFILSGISLLFLMPACIASAFYISRSILNKNYDRLLVKYFVFIKNNAIKSFKVAFPFMVILLIVLVNMVLFNDFLVMDSPSYILGIVLILQLFVAFEAFNVMLLALIQMTINPDKPAKALIRDAFLIGNRYFFRMLISSSMFVIVFMLGYSVNLLFFLISTTLVFFLYYGSFSLIIKKHFDKSCQLIPKK